MNKRQNVHKLIKIRKIYERYLLIWSFLCKLRTLKKYKPRDVYFKCPYIPSLKEQRNYQICTHQGPTAV